jgi:selenocysteine lyase/cysteine desulfurase
MPAQPLFAPIRTVADDFLGAHAPQQIVSLSGITSMTTRTYLDWAATCLMPRSVWDTVERYLETASANSHTTASAGGRATTIALHEVHRLAGSLVGYKEQTDTVVLTGNGTTAAVNLLAKILFRAPGPRTIAVISAAEHHSAMLPVIRAAGSEIRVIPTLDDGTLDMDRLSRILAADGPRIRVVVVTALSNVTGIRNPVNDIASQAHAVGAMILVDAAQAVAHAPVQMHPAQMPGQLAVDRSLDFVAYSGHKTYAPGSPGVLVGRTDIINSADSTCADVGGGTVDNVTFEAVEFKKDPSERLEAGTPNIPGSIALGTAIKMIQGIGIPEIRRHEKELVQRALDGLSGIEDIVIYGSTDPENRGGIVSFNLMEIPHGLVAAALNDYCAISVRNGCFCAEVLVRAQIDSQCNSARGFCLTYRGKKRGMVRASLGLSTADADIDLLIESVKWIQANRAEIERQYEERADGSFVHRTFRPESQFVL